MKQSATFFLILATAIVHGCSGSNSGKPVDGAQLDTASAPKNYFPVNTFLKNEISYADTFFTTFIKYTITEQKTDSAVINPDEFKQLASEFTTNDLSKESLEKDYTEASFMDKTTGAATFTYSTTNTNLPVQRVDVLTKPGETYDKISSIYIEKTSVAGDTVFRKKMFWKSHKNFQVITETTSKGQAPKISRFKIVWDASE